MVGKRKETRVFVYARCFGTTWCDEQNLEYDKKLSGIIQRKLWNYIALSKWTLTVLMRRLTLMMCTCTRWIRKDLVDFARNGNVMYENAENRMKTTQLTTILTQMVALVRI